MFEAWHFSEVFVSERPEVCVGQIKRDLNSKDVVMYNFPWDNPEKPWKECSDGEPILRKVLGRGFDLRVGIYNPRRSLVPEGNFDFIVKNAASGEKAAYIDD